MRDVKNRPAIPGESADEDVLQGFKRKKIVIPNIDDLLKEIDNIEDEILEAQEEDEYISGGRSCGCG